jgi:hypothetical protein
LLLAPRLRIEDALRTGRIRLLHGIAASALVLLTAGALVVNAASVLDVRGVLLEVGGGADALRGIHLIDTVELLHIQLEFGGLADLCLAGWE